MSNDVAQVLFFGVVAAVAGLALWYIFIHAPKSRAMALGPWASKRGLAFTPPVPLGAHTTGHEVSGLHGVIQGVGMTIHSARFVNSRRAGINGSTEIMLRAISPANVAFEIELMPTPMPPGPTTLVLGDPMFDARVSTRTSNPQAAHAWLSPHLRALLPAIVQDGAPVVVAYANGETTVRFAKPISDEAGLDRAIGLALAAAHARLY